jgi:hypothetical protein
MLIRRLIEFIERRATPKMLIILVMALLPFNVLLFPLIGDRLETLSGYRLLDVLFNYSPSDVFTRLEAYGEQGRRLYLIEGWTVDLIYPVVYTLLLAVILTLLLSRAFSPGSPLIRLQLLPFGMMLFDYLENTAVALLLIVFPARPDWLAACASLFTSLKWCFGAFSIAALMVAVVGFLVTFTRSSKLKGS